MSADNPEREIIGRERARSGDIVIYADRDRLKAWLSYQKPDKNISVQEIREYLFKIEVSFGLLDDALEAIVAAAREEKATEMLLLAEGVEPVPGCKARLDFSKRPIGTRAEVAADDIRIDHREIASIDNVKAGDLLAKYIPAIEGRGGTDIFNKTITTPKVSDFEITIGENVRFEMETNEYFATTNGYVSYEQGQITVSTVYRVRGSVNLSHGNIRFVGAVEVEQDVPDEFQVVAAEGIKIGGTAEACQLRSGGDIVIGGGVTGKGKGKIEAKGSVTARFLGEVDVICTGDVIVTNEILNARIYTLGRVIIQRGTIVGGEVVALKGIFTQSAGSELGVKTTLIAGIDYRVHEKVIGVHRELAKVTERQQGLLDKTGLMIERAMKSVAVDNRVREEIRDNWLLIRAQQKTIKKLEAESGTLCSTFAREAICCVSITDRLYGSVVTVVGKFESVSSGEVKGPLSLVADEKELRARLDSGLRLEKLWEKSGYPPLK